MEGPARFPRVSPLVDLEPRGARGVGAGHHGTRGASLPQNDLPLPAPAPDDTYRRHAQSIRERGACGCQSEVAFHATYVGLNRFSCGCVQLLRPPEPHFPGQGRF